MRRHLVLLCAVACRTVKLGASRTCSSLHGPYCNHLPQALKLPSHFDALLDDTIPETKRQLLLKRVRKQEIFASSNDQPDFAQQSLELKETNSLNAEEPPIMFAAALSDDDVDLSMKKMNGKQLKDFMLNILKQLIQAAKLFPTLSDSFALDELRLLVEDLEKLSDYSSYKFQILDDAMKQTLQDRFANDQGFGLQSVISKLGLIKKPKARLKVFETIIYYCQLADE
uniref:AlNc14C128G6884 protein n=1 Tax=Albugo laibachii Nc14 TaxID=890382 RepID=F0WK30_9STRA|nr:AlNc14C128G6884 [Albugo laibachii Nc14]|eukprot:CCA21632.1 AlNc14C128G6884 [Albugo laibachii Nc14]